MSRTTLLACAAATAALALSATAMSAKDLRVPPPPQSDQSYLYVDPGYGRPNLPGYMQESMDPLNSPDNGTMFGEDEQDESPGSFGLDDN